MSSTGLWVWTLSSKMVPATAFGRRWLTEWVVLKALNSDPLFVHFMFPECWCFWLHAFSACCHVLPNHDRLHLPRTADQEKPFLLQVALARIFYYGKEKVSETLMAIDIFYLFPALTLHTSLKPKDHPWNHRVSEGNWVYRHQRLGRKLLFGNGRARPRIQHSLSLLCERAKNTDLLFPQVKGGSDKSKPGEDNGNLHVRMPWAGQPRLVLLQVGKMANRRPFSSSYLPESCSQGNQLNCSIDDLSWGTVSSATPTT